MKTFEGIHLREFESTYVNPPRPQVNNTKGCLYEINVVCCVGRVEIQIEI